MLGAALAGLFTVQQNKRLVEQLSGQAKSNLEQAKKLNSIVEEQLSGYPKKVATIKIRNKDYDELKSELAKLPDDDPYKDPYKASISMLAVRTLVDLVSEISDASVRDSSASKSRSLFSTKITLNAHREYADRLSAFFRKIGHKENISKVVERAMFYVIDQRLAGKREPYGYEMLNAGIGRDVTKHYRLKDKFYADNRQGDPVWQQMLERQKAREGETGDQ